MKTEFYPVEKLDINDYKRIKEAYLNMKKGEFIGIAFETEAVDFNVLATDLIKIEKSGESIVDYIVEKYNKVKDRPSNLHQGSLANIIVSALN